MTTEVIDSPNANSAAPIENAVPSLDSIVAKMTAMRNQPAATKQTETGSSEAAASGSPVAPEGIDDDPDQPEIDSQESDEIVDSTDEAVAPEEVSESDSTELEVIDFIAFAEEHPDAKFKFKRNGKDVEIDAKKAAAILGQGGAIHEEARQLKIERSEFDEYLKEKQAHTEGLILAMEFTVKPQLQKAYDEILKTQNYQTTFNQQLAQTTDPAQLARIQAAMNQNERYISQQADVIKQLKPNVDQFYEIRRGQVQSILEQGRKSFQDKELRNEYVYKEIREKVSKGWEGAHRQLVPGIDNIDLISSDEHIMTLIRDGLKYRGKGTVRQAGNSIAALTGKRGNSASNRSQDDVNQLREKAKGGDKKAADNLLVAQLSKIRAARGR